MKNIKAKTSQLIIVIAILSIASQPTYCALPTPHKPVTIKTKALQDRTAKKYTSQLTNEEEKLENLKNDPKATEEQIEKQEKKVETLRERVTNWMNKTYKSITEMSTPAKVLLATLGITGIAVATDYAMGTGYTSAALSKMNEWTNQGLAKGREYLGWDSLDEQLKKFDREMTRIENKIKKETGQFPNAAETRKLEDEILNKYPLAKKHYADL